MEFEGRVVVVTGAAGGVGQVVSRRWLEAGAKVAAVGRTRAKLEALEPHPNLFPIEANLSIATGAEAMVREVTAQCGSPDTLLHLVGGFVMEPIDGPEAETTWRQMMEMNLDSAFYAFRAMTSVLKERGGGWMVGLGSRAAAAPGANLAGYAAAKAGLQALVQSAAAELRQSDIHVNLLVASTIDTAANRAAMGTKAVDDWVSPDDIADATQYLCSDRAKSVYGATLEVFGRA